MTNILGQKNCDSKIILSGLIISMIYFPSPA